jgi:protocatechuate 3,4-dioxygenase beta subunit
VPTSRPRTAAPRLARALACLVALTGAACKDSASNPTVREAASVQVVSGDNQEARVGTELPLPLVVRVLDEDGQPVAGQVVNFVVTGGSGTVFGGSSQTDRNGEARDRWTLGTTVADSQRVEVRTTTTAGSAPTTLATFRARATPDAAARIEPLGTATRQGSAGSALADSLSARVLDFFGNPVPGVQVMWAVRSGGGQISPATSTTNAAGIARASWTLGGRVDIVQGAEASVAGVVPRAQFTATAGLTPGTTFTITGGNGQTGQINTQLPQPLRVVVRRADGTPLPGIPVEWAPTPESGSVTPSTSLTNASGEATTTWRLGSRIGANQVVATIRDVSSTLAAQVTFTATATAGAPAAINKTGGDQSVVAGRQAASPFGVIVLDISGNGVAGVTVTWNSAGGAGTFQPATSVTNAQGVATTTWTAPTTTGSYSITASGAGLTSPPYTGTVTPGPAATLVADPPAVTMPNGQQRSVAITARDEYGNATPLQNAISVLSSNTAVVTASHFSSGGQTVVTLVSRGAGNATVTVRSTITSASVAIPVRVDQVPTSISKTGGDQSVVAGQQAASPFGVIVQDITGNGVPGVTVTWNSAGGAGTFQPATSVTNAQGVATTTWTAPTTSGSYSITASAAGLTSPPYTGTVTPGPAATLVAEPAAVTMRVGDQRFVVITGRDQYGNTTSVRNAITAVSSNTAVATVSLFTNSTQMNVVVNARGAGDATVTVRSTVTSATGQFSVRVDP